MPSRSRPRIRHLRRSPRRAPSRRADRRRPRTPQPAAPTAPKPSLRRARRARARSASAELTARDPRPARSRSSHDVWVEGELSNCRLWNTGHLYFTLKDDRAQIKGVMFRSAAAVPEVQAGRRPAASSRAAASRSTSPKGEYQLVCEHLEPQGLGALQLAFEQLKRGSQAEGLFDAARKRPLPALPRKIGIVTSLDGAAIRDILKVLRRRYATAHIVIRPDARAGRRRRRRRSRGRLTALGARRRASTSSSSAAAAGRSKTSGRSTRRSSRARSPICPVPVISAVGHETDVTIADFVADLRAPTPSAAAEMVVAAKDEFCAPHRPAGAIACAARRSAALHAEPAAARLHHEAGIRRLRGPSRQSRTLAGRALARPRTRRPLDDSRARTPAAAAPAAARHLRPRPADERDSHAARHGRRPRGRRHHALPTSGRVAAARMRRTPGEPESARRPRAIHIQRST